jgi:hypothetical protein
MSRPNQYYTPTGTCPNPPWVDDNTKMKVCAATKPVAAKYCSGLGPNTKQCENMARMSCLNSHNALELYNYLYTISNDRKCPPSCACNVNYLYGK